MRMSESHINISNSGLLTVFHRLVLNEKVLKVRNELKLYHIMLRKQSLGFYFNPARAWKIKAPFSLRTS